MKIDRVETMFVLQGVIFVEIRRIRVRSREIYFLSRFEPAHAALRRVKKYF